MKTIITICASILFPLFVNAQSKADKKAAYDLGVKGVEVMDDGRYDESIALLEQAAKLDPDDYNYPYEIAYAWSLKKDYEKGISVMEDVIAHYKGINDRCYQMLGDMYDMNGNEDKALEVYEKGLKEFPESGKLYLEAGVVYAFSKDNYDKAVEYWENGVKAEPFYSSNYYWLAKVFCSTENRVWGIMYGELFMNIERGSERTEEISKLLFDTYNEAIDIESGTAASVSFASNTFTLDAFGGKDLKLPFSMNYEMIMTLSASLLMLGNAVPIDTIISSPQLNIIRTSFLSNWKQKDFHRDYPNVLIDYQDKIEASGHLEAYNMWLFSVADPENFDTWHTANTGSYEAFIKWFTDNQIRINDKNYFLRTNY